MSAGELLNPIKLYDPSTPVGRLGYFWGNYIYPAILLVTLIFCGALAEAALGFYETTPILDLIYGPVMIGWVLATILIVIRRLRDLGKSGWLVLLGIVPLANIILALWLLFSPGVSESGDIPPSSARAESSPSPPESHSLDQATTSFCSHCGHRLEKGAAYCSSCGRKVA